MWSFEQVAMERRDLLGLTSCMMLNCVMLFSVMELDDGTLGYYVANVETQVGYQFSGRAFPDLPKMLGKAVMMAIPNFLDRLQVDDM